MKQVNMSKRKLSIQAPETSQVGVQVDPDDFDQDKKSEMILEEYDRNSVYQNVSFIMNEDQPTGEEGN